MKSRKFSIYLIVLITSTFLAACGNDDTGREKKMEQTVSGAEVEKEDVSDKEESYRTDVEAVKKDPFVEQIIDMVDQLNNDTYQVEEIETNYDHEYYLDLIGETLPGRILVVRTNFDKNYDTYQQFVAIDQSRFYTVHNKFFYDEKDYTDCVERIKDDRTYSVPIIMDKGALYIQYLENVELGGYSDSAYGQAVKEANMRIASGRDWEIIGDTE